MLRKNRYDMGRNKNEYWNHTLYECDLLRKIVTSSISLIYLINIVLAVKIVMSLMWSVTRMTTLSSIISASNYPRVLFYNTSSAYARLCVAVASDCYALSALNPSMSFPFQHYHNWQLSVMQPELNSICSSG